METQIKNQVSQSTSRLFVGQHCWVVQWVLSKGPIKTTILGVYPNGKYCDVQWKGGKIMLHVDMLLFSETEVYQYALKAIGKQRKSLVKRLNNLNELERKYEDIMNKFL